MTGKERRALDREAWPPKIQHLRVKDVYHELPTHPKQVAVARAHALKAKVYWEMEAKRHAENPKLSV
jgi:hypothetical protein